MFSGAKGLQGFILVSRVVNCFSYPAPFFTDKKRPDNTGVIAKILFAHTVEGISTASQKRSISALKYRIRFRLARKAVKDF